MTDISNIIMGEGNWYPFPPPEVGVYDVRQVRGSGYHAPLQFDYYKNRRVYRTHDRLMTMGRRVSKMTPEKGWQFRFPSSREQYRPFALRYQEQAGRFEVVERVDVSDQLPMARSLDEARYIVTQLPERWPAFVHIHIEYTQEVLSS